MNWPEYIGASSSREKADDRWFRIEVDAGHKSLYDIVRSDVTTIYTSNVGTAVILFDDYLFNAFIQMPPA